MVNLVDGEDRGGRVVDGRRKPLGGDVHHDPEHEGRVLLQGAFLTHGDRLAQGVGRQGCSALKDPEQRVPNGDEIANLRHHFDDTVGTLGHGHQSLDVEGQDHAILEVRHRARWVLR